MSHAGDGGDRLLEQGSAFGTDVIDQRQPCDVPAGLREARDDPLGDKVGSAPTTMGIVVVACWAARTVGVPAGEEHVGLECDQFGGEGGQAVELLRGKAVINAEVLPLAVAEVMEPLEEGFETGAGGGRLGKHAEAWHSGRPLRVRQPWPHEDGEHGVL